MHSAAPFVEELADKEEVARLKDWSGQPLDADPRSKAEKAAYDRSQRMNALRRERRDLLAQRETGEVPLDAHMRRWADELKQPGLDPTRRLELEEKLGARAERWEQGRRERLREVNAELRVLNREHREAIQHRRLVAARLRPVVVSGGGNGGNSGEPGGGGEPPAHRVINDLVATGRPATDAEIALIRQHVAAAGFDPNAREKAGGRAAGLLWKGKQVKGCDMLPPLEVKYLRHVRGIPEWPLGTTIEEFERSIRDIVAFSDTGVFLSRYKDLQQVGFVGRSGRWVRVK